MSFITFSTFMSNFSLNFFISFLLYLFSIGAPFSSIQTGRVLIPISLVRASVSKLSFPKLELKIELLSFTLKLESGYFTLSFLNLKIEL